jgi:hypothetical protein
VNSEGHPFGLKRFHVEIHFRVRYLTVTADVLTSVRKMEESLKRLKEQRRGKGASNTAQQGMSDDDKIRLQLYLDVQQFGHQVSQLINNISHYHNIADLWSWS